MKILRPYLMTLGVIFLPTIALAHSHEGCSSQRGNSCWFATNHTGNNVKFDCVDSYQSRFSASVAPSKGYSYQFCTGWGDGLGYPEPGVVSNCQVAYQNGGSASFEVRALGWGDRVELSFKNGLVELSQKSTWSNGSDQRLSFPVR